MPIDLSQYPPNWKEIAIAVKKSADWHCQNYNRPCRKVGEDLYDFAVRIESIAHPDLDWVNQTALSTIGEYPQRFTLTVIHLDQNPQNKQTENLKPLCAPCHLKHSRPFQAGNKYRKRESQGQLRLI